MGQDLVPLHYYCNNFIVGLIKGFINFFNVKNIIDIVHRRSIPGYDYKRLGTFRFDLYCHCFKAVNLYFTDIKSIISDGVLDVDKNTTTMSFSVTSFMIVSINFCFIKGKNINIAVSQKHLNLSLTFQK